LISAFFSSIFPEIFPIYLLFDFCWLFSSLGVLVRLDSVFTFPVRQMRVTLMRECEGSLRRYVGGSDTGDCLIIGYTDMSFLCYHESVPRNKHVRKYRYRSGHPWKGLDVVFVFYLYTRLYC